MKKIKLFLVTLLCLVGVMNVCAEVVLLPVTVGENGTGALSNNNKTWTSSDSSVLPGVTMVVRSADSSVDKNPTWGINGQYLRIAPYVQNVGYTRSNTINRVVTIIAPSGWVIIGYKAKLEQDGGWTDPDSQITPNGGTEEDENLNVGIDADQTSFSVGRKNNLTRGVKNITMKSFEIYLKRNDGTIGMLDANGRAVEFGGMYAISVEKNQNGYKDFYFYANSDNRHVAFNQGWPTTNGGFINADYVWTPELVGNDKITLQNMKHGKYLAGDRATNEDPAFPRFEDSDQGTPMLFKPSDTYKISGNDTPWFYTLETERTNPDDAIWKYLNFLNSDGNVGFTLYNDGDDAGSRFRFHEIEYIVIAGVYLQNADGVCEPISYSVNGGNVRTGRYELYHEHAEDRDTRVVTKTINGKITSILPGSAISGEYDTKYIVNGVVQTPGFAATDLKHTNVVDVVFVPKTPVSKFVKIKNNIGQYIKAGDAGSDLTVAANSNDALFYLDGTTLLSYTKGVYVKDTKVGDIEESGSTMLLIKNSADAKVAVKSGASYIADNGSSVSSVAEKPEGAYTVEYISELPVKLNPVGDHRYGTFYAPVDVIVPTGLEAYRVDGITPGAATTDPDVLGLVLVTEIPANTGVILYEEAVSETEYALTITSDVVDVNSLLDGVCPRRIVKENETLYGLNKKTINGKETAGFYKMKTGSALSPFRAFLDYTESEQGESKGFVFSFTELDAIEAIEMSHADDTMYDLQGRRVQNPGTGIYIVNGKKIMIKK